MTYIFAGTFAEAEQYAKDHRLLRWKFLGCLVHETLAGRADGTIVKTGTWRNRKDLDQVLPILNYYNKRFANQKVINETNASKEV